MSVAHDISSESHTGTTGSQSEASFTWNHNPVGVPRGILVFTFSAGGAVGSHNEHVSSVTYDGVALTAVPGGAAVDALDEPGRCTAWFLGSSVPTTDPAAIVVNRTNDAAVMYAIGLSVTAAADVEPYGVVLLEGDLQLTEQNVTDGSTGITSVRYCGAYCGLAAPPAAGANSTNTEAIDIGAFGFKAVYETTPGQGSRPIGFAGASSDDAAAVHLAIREVVAAGGHPHGRLPSLGVG